MEALLEPGGRGELSVSVGPKKVAEKSMFFGFPSDEKLFAAIKAEL